MLKALSFIWLALLATSISFAKNNNYVARIGIIDLQAVEEQSLAMQIIIKTVKSFSTNIAQQFSNEEAELKKLEANLIKKKNQISETEYDAEVLKFHNKVAEVQRLYLDSRTKLNKVGVEARQKVEAILATIIQEIAQEQKLDIVLPANTIVFANHNLAITNEVVKRLNIKIPIIDVKY